MPKLDTKFVAKVKAPPDGRKIYWDDTLKGFGLLVMASGHTSFVFQYRVVKKLRRMTLDADDVDTARTQAEVVKGQVAAGRLLNKPIDPLADRRRVEAIETGKGSFKAVAKEWLNRDGRYKRSGAHRFDELERLAFPVIGDLQINEIKRSDIVRLLDKIQDENGPGMADYILSAVRRVMSWYESRGEDENFVSPVRRGMARTSTSVQARQRILTDDELRALWNAAEATSGPYGAFLQFLLLTATRREEAAKMRRSELLSGDWLIPAERMKGKREHVVPLSAAALAFLDCQPRLGKGDLVFTASGRFPINSFVHRKAAFDKLMLANLHQIAEGRDDQALLAYVLKVEELMRRIATAKGAARRKLSKGLNAFWWTLHDLRRTARSLMSRAGVDADIAERCLAHVIGGIRGVYDRYAYLEEKRHALEKLAALIERIVNPPADNVTSLDKRRARGVSQVPG